MNHILPYNLTWHSCRWTRLRWLEWGSDEAWAIVGIIYIPETWGVVRHGDQCGEDQVQVDKVEEVPRYIEEMELSAKDPEGALPRRLTLRRWKTIQKKRTRSKVKISDWRSSRYRRSSGSIWLKRRSNREYCMGHYTGPDDISDQEL